MVRRRATTVAAITVATVVAIGALSALAIQASFTSHLATERSKLAATAEVTAELIAEQMTSVEGIEQAAIEQSAFVSAIGTGDPARFDAVRLQSILDQLEGLRVQFQFSALADAQGTTRVVSPANPALIGRNFAFRDWYRGVMRTGRPYVSQAYVSAVQGAPLVVAVATQIHGPDVPGIHGAQPGPVVGVMFIGYKVDGLQAFADQLASLQQIDLRFTDQAGVVLTRAGGISGHLVTARSAPEVAGALAGRATSVTTSDAIAAGAPVPGIGWTVSASTPLSGTAAAAERGATTLIAVSLLFVVGIAGAALAIVIRRLERANSLQTASQAELLAVHQALTEMIHVYGPDGNLVSRNPAAQRFDELAARGDTDDRASPNWELLRQDGSILPPDEGPLARVMRSGDASEPVVVGVRLPASERIAWLSVSTIPIRGARGVVSGYVSSAHDVTERIDTIRELRVVGRASEALSSTLVPDEVIRCLTRAASEICSVPGEEQRRAHLFMVRGAMMTIVGEYDPEGPTSEAGLALPVMQHPQIQAVIATRTAVAAPLDYERFGPAVTASMRRTSVKNGAWVPLVRNDAAFAVLAVGGRQHALVTDAQLERLTTLATIGALALANAEAHERVADLARTDPLTGVGNRRALEERMRQMPRTRWAMVAIDVDNLKTVNDTHGHGAGDELLAAIATVMAAELRPSDMLARTGGDEFVALLVDCDADGAAELGRRLQRAAARLRFVWGDASISVGSAAGSSDDPENDVAKAADEALYVGKRLNSKGPSPPPEAAART